MYGILWVLVRAVAWLCFRFRVIGTVPKRGGLLVAANHASYFDIPLLGCGMSQAGLVSWVEAICLCPG